MIDRREILDIAGTLFLFPSWVVSQLPLSLEIHRDSVQ